MKKIVFLEFDWAIRRYEITPFEFLNRPDLPDVVHVGEPYASFGADNFLKEHGTNCVKIAILNCSFPDITLSNQNLSIFDVIIVIDPEIITIDEYFDILSEKFSNNKIIVLSSCPLDSFHSLSTVLTVPWFFLQTQLVNHQLNLTSINSFESKPKLFDALLGINKPHRKFIFDCLKDSNLLDNAWVSLSAAIRWDDNPKPVYYKSQGLTELELAQVHPAINSVDMGFDSYMECLQHPTAPQGTVMRMASNLIPANIYDTSYYSIVAETHYPRTFFTEKTAKPLLAHRLFVLFGAYRQLEKLRSFGFETFGAVIDESYDSEPDDYIRWKMAFEQVVELSKNNPEKVLKKIDDVLTHNQNLINNREHFIAPVRNWVWEHINRIY
jgi:hypothetical protein